LSGGFSEDIERPFSHGTVVGGGVSDPMTIYARGCAFQAALISSINDSGVELREAFTRETKMNKVKALHVCLKFNSLIIRRRARRWEEHEYRLFRRERLSLLAESFLSM